MTSISSWVRRQQLTLQPMTMRRRWGSFMVSSVVRAKPADRRRNTSAEIQLGVSQWPEVRLRLTNNKFSFFHCLNFSESEQEDFLEQAKNFFFSFFFFNFFIRIKFLPWTVGESTEFGVIAIAVIIIFNFFTSDDCVWWKVWRSELISGWLSPLHLPHFDFLKACLK